jgi:DinB superfamily/Pentapeptide repeats (8 copies)
VSSQYAETEAFRGATFRQADLTGARFRDCDLSGVKIASSQVDDLRINGFDGRAGKVVVDDVEVTDFVKAELDRRYPERVQFRLAATAGEFRATWNLLDRLWSETIGRAQQLPESVRQERVDDEWSFVETLRHLIFGIDIWVGRMILDVHEPFHRLGLPTTDCPPAEAADLGIDLAATPSFDEIVAEYSRRVARVSDVLAAVTDDELGQIRTAVLAPAWGEESHSVAECLRVVLNEHCEHRRFAVRDLAVLEDR